MKKRFIIGIDAGGTKVAYGLFDDEGKIIDRIEHATDAEADGPGFSDILIENTVALMTKNNLSFEQLEGVGVGMPSYIKNDTGYVFITSAMPRIKDFAMRDYLDAIESKSEQNEDFYYAVCLSVIQDLLKGIMDGVVRNTINPDCLPEIFNHFLVHQIFERKADPTFHILAQREEYLLGLQRKIEEINFPHDMTITRESIFNAISYLKKALGIHDREEEDKHDNMP